MSSLDLWLNQNLKFTWLLWFPVLLTRWFCSISIALSTHNGGCQFQEQRILRAFLYIVLIANPRNLYMGRKCGGARWLVTRLHCLWHLIFWPKHLSLNLYSKVSGFFLPYPFWIIFLLSWIFFPLCIIIILNDPPVTVNLVSCILFDFDWAFPNRPRFVYIVIIEIPKIHRVYSLLGHE